MQVRWMALLPLIFLFVTSVATASDVDSSHTGGVGTFEGAQGWANPARGTAQAAYAFNLLPARGAAAPHLRLVYSSSSDVQEAGTHWGLDLPIIERKPLQGGAPSYRDTSGHGDVERLTFNGQPLVFIRKVSSLTSTMADGTVEHLPPWSVGWFYYRLQNDASHLRFFWSIDLGSGWESNLGKTWVVQDPNGVTLEFGRAREPSPDVADALDTDPTAPNHAGDLEIYRWRLVQQYDAHCTENACNRTIYHWHNLGRTAEEPLLLTDIYDTPAPSSPTLATFAHHTHIAYELNPAAGDPSTNTVAYTKIWKQKYQLRIKRVDIAGNGENPQKARAVVRRYHLGYQTYLRRSLLTSIAEEGAACALAQEAPLPPGPFGGPTDYEAPETNCARLAPTTFEYATPHWGPSTEPGLSRFDPTSYFRVAPETPAPEGVIFPYPRNLNLIDVDRDGAMDLVMEPPDGKTGRVYLTELRNVTTYLRYFPLSNADSSLLSVDGFSLVDSADLTNTAAALWRDSTSGTPPQTIKRMRIAPVAGGFSWTNPDSGHADFSFAPAVVGDIDGNGSQDIIDTTKIGDVQYRRISVSDRHNRSPGYTHPDGVPDWHQVLRSVKSDAPDPPFSALADLNGDGVDDLVTLKPSTTGSWDGQPFIYYPGDGLGHFECKSDRSVCAPPPPGCGAGSTDPACRTAWIDLQDGPRRTLTWFPNSTTLLADINRDGLADFIFPSWQYRDGLTYGIVQIALNEDGVHFHDVEPLTLGIIKANRVMVGDVNGNGTTDIVFVSSFDAAHAQGYEGGVMEFFELEYPGLLKKITNGAGAETTFEYDSLRNLDQDARGTSKPWTFHSPVAMQVVVEVAQKQSRVGEPGAGHDGLVTKYTYRDPAYDPFENQVLGFREIEATSNRGSIVRTKYYFGHCQSSSGCAETSDADFEKPFTGVPYQTETISSYGDGPPVHSTSVSHYKVVPVYAENDGLSDDGYSRRPIAFSYLDRVDTYLYDTAPFLPATEHIAHSIVDDARAAQVDVTLASSAAHRERLRREQVQDGIGNVVETRDWGRVGSAGEPLDSLIEMTSEVGPVDDPNIYAFRVKTQTLDGNGREPNRTRSFHYNSVGDLTDIAGTLVGTLPLVRSHENGSRIAPPPNGASVDGTVKLAHFEYDAFGNVTGGHGPSGTGCFQTTYNAYAHLPGTMTQFADRCEGIPFTTAWNYNEQFDVVSTVHSADGSIATSTYDMFGRLSSTSINDPDFVAVPAPPSEISYYLSATTNTHAVSVKSPIGAGQVATSWQYFDGFGQAIASVVEGDSSIGDGTPWIVQNAIYYQEARPAMTYRPYGMSAQPESLDFKYKSSIWDAEIDYDPFGRIARTVDKERNTVFKYHALSVDVYDAEDLGTGPHANTPTTIAYDGHGRTVKVTTRNNTAGGLDLAETNYEYNIAGQVVKITKRHSQGPETFTRWMKYDSLGRQVLGAEPNTSKDFVPDPNDPSALTKMRTWRYAFDDAGRLVGTSDARGCGKNLFYDGLGRILAEDYSPCLAHHEPYTPVDLAKGTGAEAIYEYDAVGPLASLSYIGRLTSVADRGAITHFGYDARGRITKTQRRMARPVSDGPNADSDFDELARDRYGAHVFKKAFKYDLLDRVVAEETGADVEELLGSNGESSVQYTYSKGGLLQAVSSSYGPLISSIKYNVDGTPDRITYGDAAGTTRKMWYGDHDVSRYLVSRPAPPLWTKKSDHYTPADPHEPSSLQTVLADLTFGYDGVGNPTSIQDGRNPDEWPAGARPKSQALTYDDLYRLTSEKAEYNAPNKVDVQISPFAYEEDDPRSTIVPRLIRAKRSTGFDISYDFTGNTTALNDNDSTVLDRSSLGSITNGDAAGHPNRITTSSLGVRVAYDATGNVVEMLVPRTGECLAGSDKCSHHFVYDWDEVGQLVRARRWDYKEMPAHEPRYPELPSRSPDVNVRYAYSQGQRVLKSVKGSSTSERHAVEVFSSLRLDNSRFEDGDYTVNAATESVYLGDVAHVQVVQEDLPAMSSSKRHVYLTLGDALGSTNVVIDRDTGELAEDVQYHPFGTVDSDYRPERWGAHREPYQFTGKEADIEVGLTYFGARYYSAPIARWMSPDPLTIHGAAGDLNPYAYVSGAVLRLTDPMGLCGLDRDHYTGPCSPGTPPGNPGSPPPAGPGPDPRNGGPSWKPNPGKEARPAYPGSPDGSSGSSPGVIPSRPSVVLPGVPAGGTFSAIGAALYNMGVGVAAGFGHLGGQLAGDYSIPPIGGGAWVQTEQQAANEKAFRAFWGPKYAAIPTDRAGSLTYRLAERIFFIAPFLANRGMGSAALAESKGVVLAEGFAAHTAMRTELGLSAGEGTLARLDVGGNEFWGINAHGQSLSPIRANAISATHAEADAFAQAARAGVNGGSGRLLVDRPLCTACGTNGAVRSMARQLGLESLEVVTPAGSFMIIP